MEGFNFISALNFLNFGMSAGIPNMSIPFENTPQKIAIAAINPIVGDVEYNLKQIIANIEEAKNLGASLIVFSELALSGYPVEDLLFSSAFLKSCEAGLEQIRALAGSMAILVGAPESTREGIHNSAFFMADQKIKAVYRKQYLPNYGVFDERRYFIPGKEATVVEHQGIRYGIIICEDLWYAKPTEKTLALNADLMVSIHASPYDVYKYGLRTKMLTRRAKEAKIPFIYAHHVGGQDELIFDGGSMAVDAKGQRLFQAPFFHTDLSTLILNRTPEHNVAIEPGPMLSAHTLEESLHQALILGTRDYCQKNGFKSVILGLSGGIDSAVVLKIAVDALGPEQVTAWMMPSCYTSDMSIEDARHLSRHLGNHFAIHPIDPIWEQYRHTLPNLLEDKETVSAENLQTRIRANLLMAHANTTGSLVLSTVNKSELATGYCTLYGDLAGGFAVLKDVWKTWVYKLARYLNYHEPIIPEHVFTRPPTAELKPNQTDESYLMPYADLDAILRAAIEEKKSFQEIIEIYPNPDEVKRILNLIVKSEHKRHQVPPGIRVTPRAFGKDWRYPITSGFLESSH